MSAEKIAYELREFASEQDSQLFDSELQMLERAAKLLDALDAKDKRIADLEAGGWQPIETAPKDTAILLAITGFVAVGRWLDNTDTPWPWKGWSTNMGPHSEAYVRAWMPLPAPPSSLPNKEDRNG